MTSSTRAVAAAVVILVVAGCAPGLVGFAASCSETASRTATVDADGLTAVLVRAGAGSLRIVGREDTTEIRVDGMACAPTRDELERVDLTTRRSGSELIIEAPSRDVRRGQLSMTIEMPAGLPVGVNDGSGSLEIRGVASVAVEDGSGSLRVESIAGDVRLIDGSGGIDVRDIGGSVLVESDGSGGIDIRRVARDVTVAGRVSPPRE